MAKWQLSTEATKQLATLADMLRAEAEELRDRFDNASEPFREGERGTNLDSWLEELEELIDQLDNFEASGPV